MANKTQVPETNVRTGTNKESPNVTGAGETSRPVNDGVKSAGKPAK